MHEAPRTARHPAQFGIVRSDAVEFRVIAVEVHDAPHARREFRQDGRAAQRTGRRYAHKTRLTRTKLDDGRATAGEPQRHAQRVALVGHVVGRQGDKSVRVDGPVEVDRLAAGAP